ncbi:MAG: HAD family phosphatase [Lachnospiraceae bacterium]|nr:HAD family phosphatase [Lachnospiraceae bacterium]
MIRNIVFDIGNVLAAFRWEDYIRYDLGYPEEIAKVFGERFIVHPLWDEFDLGVRETNDIIADMKATVPEYRDEVNVFFERIADIVETYPYSRKWIGELKDSGYRVYLLSNYPRETFRLHERLKFDFTDLVDGKVVSGFERMSKPDPRIYRLLLDRYRLKAEECVFLDDRQVNIDTAIRLGMQGILFTGYENAKPKLEKILKE